THPASRHDERRPWRLVAAFFPCAFFGGREFGHETPQHVDEAAPVRGLRRAHVAREGGDAAQHARGIALERAAEAAAHLGERRLERVREALGRERRGAVLVDHAARRGLEGRRERAGAFLHILVEERLQLRRLVSGDEVGEQEEQLHLALRKIEHQRYQPREVALLLAHPRRRRMLARAREPHAVSRTVDLDQALGPAADRTNLLADGRTSAPGAPIAAQRADHGGHYCIIRLKFSLNSSERALQLGIAERNVPYG